MTLLLSIDALRTRREVAAGALAPLASSLATDLEPLLEREPFVPAEKAVLSRVGGRCEQDGGLLTFDPFSPRRHVCPRCNTAYEGESHYRFWLYWYQLWLAERGVHAALLWTLGGDVRYRRLAESILQSYAGQYLSYPNRDNVLGPTRPFFSTYLESIWLLQLCIATDLLEQSGVPGIGEQVRERIVEPSSALIASYGEGASNRQVWNNAALFAAYRVLGRDDAADRVVNGGAGLLFHLGEGLLVDGTWYEGDNYHQFAHRGLWYGVTMAEQAGVPMPRELVARFEEGFATPFVAALPDFTLPSRRDSQYAISLRQWRFAESCELGLARRDDPRLLGALRRLYEDDVPRRDTGRSRSSAEAERNAEPTALSRADLGWRALLFARPELPPLVPSAPRSTLLTGQGLAILRRASGRVYVALDYGHSGGGHGHPDRLNVLLQDGDARWLDDMGTGSYVDPTLHWYRSTLAHSAPLVNGRSQARVAGQLVAFEERGAAGWVCARAAELAPGVMVQRTLVAMTEYVLDELSWEAEHPVTLDLPLRLDAELLGVSGWHEEALEGSDGLEDGFRFLRDARRAHIASGSLIRLVARKGAARCQAWCVPDLPIEWWHVVAPGPPGQAEQPFWVVRARSSRGRLRIVWTWTDRVQSVEASGAALAVDVGDGERHLHARTGHGWHVDLLAGGARSSIDLGGVMPGPRERTLVAPRTPSFAGAGARRIARDQPVSFELGAAHYRRSEESWSEAGAPTARVGLHWDGRALQVHVDVPRSDRTFAPANAENPYDNERADINGDGVQLYVATSRGNGAWLLVPEAEPAVRVDPIDGWTGRVAPRARWRLTTTGYSLVAEMPLADLQAGERSIALDVIVNEKPIGRERRRGQLVLSGSDDEFVYLRGDRQDRNRLMRFTLSDD